MNNIPLNGLHSSIQKETPSMKYLINTPYIELLDKAALVVMGALIQKGDISNPWEIARHSLHQARCYLEVRQEQQEVADKFK